MAEAKMRKHLAMLDERDREIKRIERQLLDPGKCLPAVVWWVASLTGTGAALYACLQQSLQRRLARIRRERKSIITMLRLVNQAAGDRRS